MTLSELEKCIFLYGKEIYSFCMQMTENRIEADELYQDTFLTAVEQLEKLDADANPKSYLLSVAIWLWKNRKRKFAWRKRIAPIVHLTDEKKNVSEDRGNPPEDQILLREQRQMIRQEVNRLEEKYRLPICLYYMEELSLKEISEILEIPEGTVKSRLYTARKILCDKLSFFK